MKKYKKYLDIEEKYRFDLEDLLKGESIEDLMLQLKNKSEELIEIKDSKYDSPEAFLNSMTLTKEMGLLNNRVINYIQNKLNTNLVDKETNQLNQKYIVQMDEFSQKLGSEDNRLFKHEDKLRKWIQLPEFAIYKQNLEFTLNSKKHKLSDEIEEFLVKSELGNPDLIRIFDILADSEVDYGYATSSSNQKIHLTDANYPLVMKSQDESTRKSAYFNRLNGYYKHRQSFAALLSEHFKKISVDASLRKFPNTISSLLYEDQVDEKLLDILFSNVKKFVPLFTKYSKNYKKFFKTKFNKKMQLWDAHLDLVTVKNKYSVEDAQKLLLESLKPLGEEYNSVVKKIINERWVDYHNVPNKNSGAYSISSTYGVDKLYILMNFDYTINSCMTLNHEVGHSLHSYFSNKHNDYELADYPIFLAEIASIFNELMLTDYLITNSSSNKLKFFLISEYISLFKSTVINQIVYADYEKRLYDLVDQKQYPSSYEELEELFAKTMKDYSNKKKTKNDNKKHFIYSVIVPHYYYGYYVYKYAIGFIVANVFFQRYKQRGQEALNEYIQNFLSAGGNDWPLEVLRKSGIDLFDQKIYEEAYQVLEEKVNQFVELGNKIFKK